MPINILAVGDPHFKVDNIEESEHFLLQVQQYLVGNKVDSVVILGDILHSHEKIFTFALNMALKFITMCSTFAPTFCLVGNHDATSNTFFCGSNHWMGALSHMNNVTVVDHPVEVNFDGVMVLLCPYASDGRFLEMLNEFAPGFEDTFDVIFAHQMLDGAAMSNIVASGVEEWDVGYPTVISGHLHDRQTPQPNLYYPGSSQQLAFNEREDKSIALVTVDIGKHVSWEEVFLSLKQRRTLHTTVADVGKLVFRENVTYKIVVKDVDAAIKAFKKTAKYKELNEKACVASVQFKVLEENVEMQSEEDEKVTDFLSLLSDRIAREADPYLQSYYQSCLTNSEDLSDKDVQL